jgi:hypothetical protein
MNREITVEYNHEFLKSVFWIMWFDSIGITFLTGWGIAVVVCFPLILWQGFLFYALVMIASGVALGFLLFKKSAFQMNNFLSAPYTAIYRFTDIQLELMDTKFPWQSIKVVKRYPIVWFISFTDSAGYIILPTAKLDRNLKEFIVRKLKASGR